MLIQVDGSHRRWLGDDGPQFTLLLAVDDATGIVVNALFCEQENTRDYFLLMTRGLIQRYGIPIALYTDRHSVFKNVPGSGHAGAPTQFGRAMDELGIQMVFALSPQAKGRVERTAGTFHDRLVTELRLAGATTIEEANVVLKDFLVRFNERFGVLAQHPDAAYRPLGARRVPRYGALLQAQSQGGQGQHGEVQVAYASAAAGDGAAQLCGSAGRGPGRPGRPAGCALPGRDHPQPGGPTPSGLAAKLQRLFLTRATPTWRSQRSEQALGGGPGSTRRRDGRDYADDTAGRQRHCQSPQGTCNAAQEAHSTSDGKVERCSEGEAQGIVDSRGRQRTGHPSCHGKEVHGSCESAHEARSVRIGAICYHREQHE